MGGLPTSDCGILTIDSVNMVNILRHFHFFMVELSNLLVHNTFDYLVQKIDPKHGQNDLLVEHLTFCFMQGLSTHLDPVSHL